MVIELLNVDFPVDLVAFGVVVDGNRKVAAIVELAEARLFLADIPEHCVITRLQFLGTAFLGAKAPARGGCEPGGAK